MTSSITTINDFHREQREQREQSNDDTSALKRPAFICHLHSFHANDDNFKPGLYYHSIRYDKDNKAHPHDIWICAPIKIGAITRSQNNDNFGRLICFMDVHEEWREWAMPMHLLKNSSDELLGELLNLGFVFD
jgi:putative DNA primase/helicase